MRFKERRARFRAILEGDACLHPASVFDPLSARIAEDLGFEAGMFAGSVASLAVLGAPDHIVLTLSEFAEQCRRICRAGELPLMVDADHGYGNALNVMRTVEELETAGICGLSIEDTALPMGHGHPREAAFLSIEEGVGKMKAALAARRDPAFAIVGRTSMVPRDLDDGLARLRAYADAGVDALMVIGLKTRAQIEAVSNAVALPLIIGGPGPDINNLAYLSGQRARLVIRGHQPVAAAYRAVHDTLQALRAGTAPQDLEGIAAPEQMKQWSRAERYDRWIDDFLGGA